MALLAVAAIAEGGLGLLVVLLLFLLAIHVAVPARPVFEI